MATLQELMTSAFSEEKTASAKPEQRAPEAAPSKEEITKVAQELNLFDLMFPEDGEQKVAEENKPEENTEKTAEEQKIAQEQEALGSRAYDYFQDRLNTRLSKFAGEIMAAKDMEAAQGIMQPAARPPQAVPTNQDPVGDKAPMNPVKETPYSVAAGQEAGAEGQVGLEEQHKTAASIFQKVLLKRGLGQ